jgi:hypothetical protein
MDQKQAGIRSTKSSRASNSDSELNHMDKHEQAPNNDKTNMVFMTIVEVEGQLFTDQTGRLPVTSNQGNNYIVVFYAVDPNYIKSYPIKSRHRSEILRAYEEVYAFLRVRGYRPQLHKLDNKLQMTLSCSSRKTIANYNTLHLTYIEQTPRKEPSACGKITS